MSEINNTQIVKDIDIKMTKYNLIEYSDNYSKTSGSLRHYYRDEPFLTMVLLRIFLLIIIMMLQKMFKLEYH